MYHYPLLEKLDSPKHLKKFSLSELNALAEEIRLRIIEIVRENGGHLGPNLGTVEIIIAAHFVFDFSMDKLVFDVGHQPIHIKLSQVDINRFLLSDRKAALADILINTKAFMMCFVVDMHPQPSQPRWASLRVIALAKMTRIKRRLL